MKTQPSAENISETVLLITAQKKPETVNELVHLVEENTAASKNKIFEAIMKLQSEGRLKLTTHAQPPPSISVYFQTSATLWYWSTVILSFAALAATLAIPQTSYPIVYVRYVLATPFVLFLPGYALIKALFPRHPHAKTNEKDLDIIERAALSLGTSLALVPMVGLLLNYTPWGIRLTPIVLSLLMLTLIFATAAVTREYRTAETPK